MNLDIANPILIIVPTNGINFPTLANAFVIHPPILANIPFPAPFPIISAPSLAASFPAIPKKLEIPFNIPPANFSNPLIARVPTL